MASLHRNRGRDLWFVAFRGPDGKRHFKSTGTTDRAQAEEMARGFTKAVEAARESRLTPMRAREIIESVVREIAACAGTPMPVMYSLEGWLGGWLERHAPALAPNSLPRYQAAVRRCLAFAGQRVKEALWAFDESFFTAWRDDMATGLAAPTVNQMLQLVRGALAEAVRKGILLQNPLAGVKGLRARKDKVRKPFSFQDVNALLARAPEGDWPGMILMGLYTGQRLRDIADLRWQALDFDAREIHFMPIKTEQSGKRVIIPMHPALERFLAGKRYEGMKGTDRVFGIASITQTAQLSAEFRRIMRDAGLHQDGEINGNGQRRVHPHSFHSLRHTLSTALRSNGANEATAKAMLGHGSDAVAARYTHMDAAALRPAIEKLPEVTI
jgi:integrase